MDATAQTGVGTAEVTASSLAFPFAERFVPADRAFTAGTQLPCTGAKMQSKPLADLLVAIALWDLRERGLAGLEMAEHRGLIRRTQKLSVRRLGPPLGTAGIEDGLLAAVTDDPKRNNAVFDIVWRWLGRDSNEPYKQVIQAVVQALSGAGYYQAVDAERGRVTGAILGNTKLDPVCERITGLRPQFEALAERWSAFQRREPELYTQLLKSVSEGISSRRSSSD